MGAFAMQSEEIVVADSLAAVEALRPIWATLPVRDIDADIDYFLTVVATHPHVRAPHVIHIRTADHDMIVVARIEEQSQPFKLGYSTLFHIRQRALVLSFDGILGARDRADEERAILALRAALTRGEADRLILPNLDITGPRFKAALTSTNWFFRGHGQRPSHRWVIDLPESLDAFLTRRSASTRKKIRREERALDKLFHGTLEMRCFSTLVELDGASRDMKAVADLSYQHGLGVGFSGAGLDLALLRLGFEKGWERVWMLYCAGRPVAFWSGTSYAGSFAVGTPGFDPAYSRHTVGRYAMFRMIADLCRDPDVSRMDFGQGEAEYKSRYGRPLRLERHLYIAAPRLFPLLVLWLQSGFNLANTLAARLVTSFGWLSRLKTHWRKRSAVVVADAEVAP